MAFRLRKTSGAWLAADALATDENLSFKLIPLSAKEDCTAAGGFISHVFDWGVILAPARDCFAARVNAHRLGVSLKSFGLSQELSPDCARNADEAFRFLLDYCSK